MRASENNLFFVPSLFFAFSAFSSCDQCSAGAMLVKRGNDFPSCYLVDALNE